MYDLQDWAAVHRVYKQTGSKRETARILGMARNTVRDLLEKTEPPIYHRKPAETLIDPFRQQIIDWRCAPFRFNGTRIFKELQKIGYKGSIGPLYRFLRRVDEDIGNISSNATERIETPSGDQAQFDWSEYLVVVGGRTRRVYCFSMILAASRKKAILFSLREDAAAIYDAIQELFEELGGVTLELLIDNPKALVIENDPKTEEEIRYNPYALLLAKHLGTELNACPYYWPRKKGKVERPFSYICEQFIKGNTFATMDELNRRGKGFIDEWNSQVHTTTGRIPNEHYLLEEKQTLQELPKTRFRHKEPQKRKVSPDSFVSIDGSKYSVPVKYVGKKLDYRLAYGFRIELYDRDGDLVLSTEKSDVKGAVRKVDEHYADIAVPVSTSIPQIRRDFSALFPHGQQYLDAADKKFDQPTHHARKILLLRDLYDDATLNLFIAYSIEQDRMDITSFKSILREYNSGTLTLAEIRSAGKGKDGPLPDAADLQGYRDDEPGLTRDCSYYEEYAMKGEAV